MRNRRPVRAFVIAVVAAASIAAAPARAGELIAHPYVNNLNADDIRNVYLGEKQLAGSLRLVPVWNLAAAGEFLSKVLQTDDAKYQARWFRKRFREGLSPPPTLGSDAEVVAFVRSTPGAIGYVSSIDDASALGVKVLERY